MKNIINIPEDVYREIAETIRVEAEFAINPNVRIEAEAERGNILFCVTFSGVAYHREYLYPEEFRARELKELVPTWIECVAFDETGEERISSFESNKLMKYLDFR